VLFPKNDQIQSITVVLHPDNIIAEKEILKAMDTHPSAEKKKTSKTIQTSSHSQNMSDIWNLHSGQWSGSQALKGTMTICNTGEERSGRLFKKHKSKKHWEL
jgi:hypothetical protein